MIVEAVYVSLGSRRKYRSSKPAQQPIKATSKERKKKGADQSQESFDFQISQVQDHVFFKQK